MSDHDPTQAWTPGSDGDPTQIVPPVSGGAAPNPTPPGGIYVPAPAPGQGGYPPAGPGGPGGPGGTRLEGSAGHGTLAGMDAQQVAPDADQTTRDALSTKPLQLPGIEAPSPAPLPDGFKFPDTRVVRPLTPLGPADEALARQRAERQAANDRPAHDGYVVAASLSVAAGIALVAVFIALAYRLRPAPPDYRLFKNDPPPADPRSATDPPKAPGPAAPADPPKPAPSPPGTLGDMPVPVPLRQSPPEPTEPAWQGGTILIAVLAQVSLPILVMGTAFYVAFFSDLHWFLRLVAGIASMPILTVIGFLVVAGFRTVFTPPPMPLARFDADGQPIKRQ
mgnify:CR=1 FL=1